MLERLEAERRRADLSVALAAGGRMVTDEDLAAYMRELSESAEGGRQQRKAAPITLAQARLLGLRPPPDEAGEGVKE